MRPPLVHTIPMREGSSAPGLTPATPKIWAEPTHAGRPEALDTLGQRAGGKKTYANPEADAQVRRPLH